MTGVEEYRRLAVYSHAIRTHPDLALRDNSMPNRRSFLWLSSLGVASAAAPSFAQPSASPSSMPPAIASLVSMAHLARPITTEERRGRVEKARGLMASAKLDALLLAGGTSLVYFANVRWWVSERFFGIVIPARAKPFIVCPAFEEGRAREQLASGPFADADVLTWKEDDDPYARLRDGLKDRGIAGGRIGVEETTRFVFADGVASAAPALTVASGTPVTAGCRIVKDEHELELMRLASQVTYRAYEAAWKSLADGMTQAEFAKLVSLAHRQLGYEGDASVQIGEYSALPHGSATAQVIRPGTILLVDGGCTVEGYASDISRTFVLGKPTDEMRRVFGIVRRAQAAALAAARPGTACGDVDAAARKVVADAGFGPDYKYFTHRVGHGIGMDGHEWPYLVRGNPVPLAPGMTFSDEPGIYIPGQFGVRLEDDMVITADGAELLTPQSPSLEDPFGAPATA
jgi:Xaa-Pro dipeptidase